MWIGRSIFLGGKKIYPTSLCIFISSNGVLSIFNMFVMVFIRGAEGGRDQQELTDNFISQTWQSIILPAGSWLWFFHPISGCPSEQQPGLRLSRRHSTHSSTEHLFHEIFVCLFWHTHTEDIVNKAILHTAPGKERFKSNVKGEKLYPVCPLPCPCPRKHLPAGPPGRWSLSGIHTWRSVPLHCGSISAAGPLAWQRASPACPSLEESLPFCSRDAAGLRMTHPSPKH